MENVVQLFFEQSKSKRLAKLPKGGDAMSTYEIIIVIFTSMSFLLGLLGFIISLIDIFLKRK